MDIIEKWLSAWALSRELPLPVKFLSGYKIDVGYEQQKTRYVFAALNEDFIRLSETINIPWVFLKVCASAEEVQSSIPGKWTIQPQAYMMSCNAPMDISKVSLPDGYETVFYSYNETTVVKIISESGELASIGRVVIVDDLAVYDRISTEEQHQRKGLATFLIMELEQVALSKNIYRNFLVATAQGKLLYQSLGWNVYSPYTSAVITF